VIRLNKADHLEKIIEALTGGEVRALEITMTTPEQWKLSGTSVKLFRMIS
jgi:2-keto-3-deoxy-6-phosphogluconate aldolase